MLSKKHNDPFYWKNKLETLDSLPGAVAMEKDALWNKLHSRLQQKPTSNKALWFWIAAAILPLLIMVLLTDNKKEEIFTRDSQQKRSDISTAPLFLSPVSKEAITIITSADVKQQVMNYAINKKAASKITIDTQSNVAVIMTLPETEKIEPAVNSVAPVDTVESIAVAKKKLAVIHVNELETFPAQFTSQTDYAKSLSESKNKKAKNNNITIAPQQNSLGFKIKLSSKN